MNTVRWLDATWQDTRYAFRMMRRSPGTTVVAMLSLALGIGATTAIFSVIYGVLISPYPYAHPDEIWAPVLTDAKDPQNSGNFRPVREYVELKKLPLFADSMTTVPETRLLTGDRTPESFTTISVTANGHRFLGVPPVIGRTLQASDIDSTGEPSPVIVLSSKAWSRLFNSRLDALGKTLILNDQPFTVVGVMPPRFGWFTDSGGWVAMPERSEDTRYGSEIFRLKPGITPTAAGEQIQALQRRLAAIHPEDYPKAGFTTSLRNYLSVTVASGEMESSLRLLFGAVAFLLLIACANVANLQLARSTARAHEVSVRLAIGAGRKRLIRQLLTESVVLSLSGGIAGILLALVITRGVVALMPEWNLPNEARITVNGYVLLFSAVISVTTGILFGLAPALRASRSELADVLKQAGRGSGAGIGKHTRDVLVVVEIALAVVLLMGASLTIRGFRQLLQVDTGYHKEHVLIAGLQLPPKRYTTYDERIRFAERVLDSVSALPGVESVAIANGGTPFAGRRSSFSIPGLETDNSRQISINLVSAGYAQSMGIPVIAGRDLSSLEVSRAQPVALINQTAAKLWSNGRSPIGARVHLNFLEKPDSLAVAGLSPVVTVIGVIGDTKNDGLRKSTLPAISIPFPLIAQRGRNLVVRTRGEPMALLNAVRSRVQAVDPAQPLSRPITLEEVVGFDTRQPQFNVALFSFFAFLGLLMATIGIYSMLSYSVERRTQEIGIRMALGALRGDVVRWILGAAGRLVAVGLAAGLIGSLILDRVLRSKVFEVPGTDPMAVAIAITLLLTAAALGCVAPAWRAARLNPMSALRHD